MFKYMIGIFKYMSGTNMIVLTMACYFERLKALIYQRQTPSLGRVPVPNCQHVVKCHVNITKEGSKTICGIAANDFVEMYTKYERTDSHYTYTKK